MESIYTDPLGIVWIGTYRLGLASYYGGRRTMTLMPWGDICSMTQAGNLIVIGSNDKGIGIYNLATHSLQHIGKAQSGLGSDIVVTTLHARDGSCWFGTFDGGLARWKDGHFTVYRKKKGGLGTDNIWSLCQLPDGRIAIGTLGSGVQLLDAQ